MKKEEFYYMFEAFSDMLTQVDPSLCDVNHILVISEPFENGSEANIYLSHISDSLAKLSDGELIVTENPGFFPNTKKDDFSYDWEESVASNVVIYDHDDRILGGGRLMAANVKTPTPLIRTIQ